MPLLQTCWDKGGMSSPAMLGAGRSSAGVSMSPVRGKRQLQVPCDFWLSREYPVG